MRQDYNTVVEYILKQLRKGNLDSELFVKLLADTGLTEPEAEKALDELIKKVEDEN